MKNNTLVMFTSSYPYKGGEQFIETEIEFLAKEFEKIIIVPAKKNNIIRKVPKNIIIDDYIANINKSIFNRIFSLFDMQFISHLSLNKNEVMLLAINMLYIKYYKKWLSQNISKFNLTKTLFYSYWFDSATIASFFVKKQNPKIKFITRVHGGDLYESVHSINYFPFRQEVLENINKIFSISENGKRHLFEKYKIDPEKIIVSKLGVLEHGKISSPSSDDIFRVISCSWLTPVKRVHLIIEALSKIKKYKIEWVHFGDGLLKQELEKLANSVLPNNVKYNFAGFVDNSYIYEYYAKNPVDLFINCSGSEGIPVSIMEAQSFGIPVMATNVGGTSEIVNNDNGYLIESNDNIVDSMFFVLIKILQNKSIHNQKREKSLNNFLNNFSADKNYIEFTKIVKEL